MNGERAEDRAQTEHNLEEKVDFRSEAQKLFSDLKATSTAGPGITREPFGPGEQAAMELISAYAERKGLESYYDGAANLVVVLPGENRQKPCIVCGSHLDSVPHGGNYDGAAGVVAALLAISRMKVEGIIPRQDIRVMAFRCEESAWFGKPYIGSSALFGQLSEQDLTIGNRAGNENLAQAMSRCGAETERIGRGEVLLEPNSIAVYLELHIEQGPVMVARKLPTAIVTGIRGAIRHKVITCRGQAGHSGAVPRWLRKDALFAMAELINTLDEHWRALLERGLDLVVTSGIVATNAEVHAMTRIPDEVSFCLEIRSQSVDALEAFYHLMRTECTNIEKGRGVCFEFDRKLYTAPAKIDEGWVNRLKAKSEQLGLPAETIPSGAGHDAAVFSNMQIPTAMIFVRNENGSHNPDEALELDDFLAGLELMYHTLKEPL